MNVKELFEAKYAGGPPSWTSDIKDQGFWKGDLKQFVKINKKILDEVYEVMEMSFILFYEMSIDYMDEQPWEYSEKNRDPIDMAQAWYEGWTNDFNMEESPAYIAATRKLEGPDFDNALVHMKSFIVTNARHIVNEN